MADPAHGRSEVRSRQGQALVAIVALFVVGSVYQGGVDTAVLSGGVAALTMGVIMVWWNGRVDERGNHDRPAEVIAIVVRVQVSAVGELTRFEAHHIGRRPAAVVNGAIEIRRDGFTWRPLRSEREVSARSPSHGPTSPTELPSAAISSPARVLLRDARRP